MHCIKDPTRGGVATSLNEIAMSSEVSIALDEKAIPVRAGVRGACEILGLDPLTIANEGKLLAIVAPEGADAALAAMRAHPTGTGSSDHRRGACRASRDGLSANRYRWHARARYAGGRSITTDLLTAALCGCWSSSVRKRNQNAKKFMLQPC